jgi:hypothetical protein
MLKKICAVSILCAATLFSSTIFAAGKLKDFQVLLFNSTNLTQPLHYTITHEGMQLSKGMLGHDEQTGAIAISDFGSGKEIRAEIQVTDNAGNLIWNSTITYWPDQTNFYTKTIALDSKYHVGTHEFPSTHQISFDIIN